MNYLKRLWCRWRGHRWGKAIAVLETHAGPLLGYVKTRRRCGEERIVKRRQRKTTEAE